MTSAFLNHPILGPLVQREASPRLRAEVMCRDNFTCQYCSGAANTLDHVMPWSRGGLTVASNLVAACSFCNESKGDRTPDEWRQAQATQQILRLLAHRRTRRGRIETAITRSRAPVPRPGYLTSVLRS